jgi:hypothetical protein
VDGASASNRSAGSENSFFLVFHRALPDLQRMKLCHSVAASSASRSVAANTAKLLGGRTRRLSRLVRLIAKAAKRRALPEPGPWDAGCWPVLMTGSRPEASTRSIRFHLARAHWRALRGRHVLAAYGLGSGIENSKDSRSEDHSTLRKCHVWQLASARPYYLRSYPRPLHIPRKLSGK